MTDRERNGDPQSGSTTEAVAEPRGPLSAGSRISLLAAVVVILLTLGALLWPREPIDSLRGLCLVYDPSGPARETSLYRPLCRVLSSRTGQALRMRRVDTVSEFLEQAQGGVDLAICPDGLGLSLDRSVYVPLALGRRPAPRNLRPRGVLLYPHSLKPGDRPWLEAPDRTIFGDSLSLVATGVLRTAGIGDSDLPAGCAYGPDPYDHSPALHALRLGCYDFALVRQWDAERFFSEGLLDPQEWGLRILTDPVPDLVIFAARRVPAPLRLELGEAVAGLGLGGDEGDDATALAHGLAGVHLSGFHLLVEPDLDRIRAGFPGNWPPAGR